MELGILGDLLLSQRFGEAYASHIGSEEELRVTFLGLDACHTAKHPFFRYAIPPTLSLLKIISVRQLPNLKCYFMI